MPELFLERHTNRIPGDFVVIFPQGLDKYHLLCIFPITDISNTTGLKMSYGPSGKTAFPTA